MPHTPTLAALPPALQATQRRWLGAPRAEQDEIYATEFGPDFAPLFGGLPLYGAPDPEWRPRVLISVMGLSWQPVALMAAWARPKRLIVLGTEESFRPTRTGREPLALISALSGISHPQWITLDPEDDVELAVYREVKKALGGPAARPDEVAIDPTGGKKSMSVAAGLAGFVAGCRLLYVDYAQYANDGRLPVAGTEYPRLLANPLEVLGDFELRQVQHAFDVGDFDGAHDRAEALALRLHDAREAHAYAHLALAYGLWARFALGEAADAMKAAHDYLSPKLTSRRWKALGATVQEHAALLGDLAATPKRPDTLEAGMPMVLNHLAAAERARDRKRYGIAVLLAYATLERYTDLVLWVEHGLDDGNPDYTLITGDYERGRERYLRALRSLAGDGAEDRPPAGKISYGSGLALGHLLQPQRFPLKLLKDAQKLAFTRNHCEFEHGFRARPVAERDANKGVATARDFIALHYGSSARELDAHLEPFRFPRLEAEPATRGNDLARAAGGR